MTGVSVAVHTRDLLGEGPVWDAEADCLYWVDIRSRLVHRWDPARDARRQDITSARQNLDAAALSAQPLAGAVLAIEPGVRGLVEPRFAG
jgi:sugar lactone lactonase YvrE